MSSSASSSSPRSRAPSPTGTQELPVANDADQQNPEDANAIRAPQSHNTTINPDVPAPAEIEDFVQRLLVLTEQERNIEEAESHLLVSSCPFSLLEKRGLALGNLAVSRTSIGLGGKTLLDLSRPAHLHNSAAFPPHSFRPGDLTTLIDASASSSSSSSSSKSKSKGKAAKVVTAKGGGNGDAGPANNSKGSAGNGVQAVVWKVLESKIVVALTGGTGATEESSPELPERIRLLKVANPSTFDRQEKALRTLLYSALPLPPPHYSAEEPAPPASPRAETPISEQPPPASSFKPKFIRSPLIPLLLGITSPPESLPPSDPPVDFKFFDPLLNPSQKAAVEFCLSPATPLALIWGPPGTGKTQTLTEIVRHLVADNLRILICGASNQSVDNLLARLSRSEVGMPKVALTRIGHPARVLQGLGRHTLDAMAGDTDASQLLGGITKDLTTLTTNLTASSGPTRIRGKARKEAWDEVRALRKEYRKREAGVVKEVLGGAKVVLATCHGSGGRVLEYEKPFDVVIIDEAGQAVEPSCWIPILKGSGKLILAGDHLQLPPTIKSLNSKVPSAKKAPTGKNSNPSTQAVDAFEAAGDSLARSTSEDPSTAANDSVPGDEGPPQAVTEVVGEEKARRTLRRRLDPPSTLELTLFSRLLALHGPGIRRMLTTQYRFNEKINAFPSMALYGNELVADKSVKSRVLSDLPGVERDDDVDEPVVFIDTAGAAMYERVPSAEEASLKSESKTNENEASLVVEHVAKLVAANVPASAIAIVSPYNAQVALLASLIHPEHQEVEIASIDSFQGREQEVVIISLVRSNEKGEVGFLREERRLNVAMTRPRRQLVVVGDSETVSKGSPFLKSWMSWLEENADVRFAQ